MNYEFTNEIKNMSTTKFVDKKSLIMDNFLQEFNKVIINENDEELKIKIENPSPNLNLLSFLKFSSTE
jgi:hypothetical protein